MANAEKVTAVAEITEQFKNSTAAVVTEYRGLSVSKLTELRRALGTNATYSVAKNTLVKRAAAEAGVEGLDELFVGPTAIAFIKGEPVDAAKAIKAFAKDNKALDRQGRFHGRQSAVCGRSHQDRRPGLARGSPRQARRRNEGQPCPRLPACSTLLHRRSPVWPQRCRRRSLPKRANPHKADPHQSESQPIPSRGSATGLKKGTPSWRSSALTSCSTHSRK